MGAFALPGFSSQLQPHFPCAVFVFVFSPLPGLLGEIYLQERKGSSVGGIPLLEAPAHFGPCADEMCGLGWAVTSLSLRRV